MSSCLVKVKRYDDEFLRRLLEIPSRTLIKRSTAAAARCDDDDTTVVVGVYDIILPSNCMRKAYYRRKLAFLEPSNPIMMPYIIRGESC